MKTDTPYSPPLPPGMRYIKGQEGNESLVIWDNLQQYAITVRKAKDGNVFLRMAPKHKAQYTYVKGGFASVEEALDVGIARALLGVWE